MRKLLTILVLLCVFSMAQAHDQVTTRPIIALSQNKLYAVSAEDGSSQVLAEMPEGQTFFRNHGFDRLSPDGTHLAYATENNPESPGYKVTLFVLDLATAQSQAFEPKGGVFNVQPRTGYHYRVNSPTWSLDGTRLYYVRSAVDNVDYGKFDEIQVAYWDVASDTHKLVARLDPKQQVFDLWAVNGGIIVRLLTTLGQPEPLVFYGADGRMVKRNQLDSVYPYPVTYEGETYYAIGSQYGAIAKLVNVTTGEEIPLKADHDYPAAQSRLGGDKSMMIFRIITDDSTEYRIFGGSPKENIDVITETSGVRYSFAPDGQSLAYLQSGTDLISPIRIVMADGSKRVLAFIADEIYWSTAEYVAFHPPVLG